MDKVLMYLAFEAYEAGDYDNPVTEEYNKTLRNEEFVRLSDIVDKGYPDLDLV